jgi:hypothetical protein
VSGTKDDLAQLYRARWNAEIFHLDYRSSAGLYVERLAA